MINKEELMFSINFFETLFICVFGLIGWGLLMFWGWRAFESISYGTYTWDFNNYNELILEVILITTAFIGFVLITIRRVITSIKRKRNNE